jgi:GTP-binding protein Era
MTDTATGSRSRRCGFIALLGAPNVGKSTLLNQLVGTKVSIVSRKVQTTRRRVLGITIKDGAQLVFIDTPGIFEARANRPLERAMVRAAWVGADDADLRILVVDARRKLEGDTKRIVDGLAERRGRTILAVNKLDLVPPAVTLPLIQAYDATGLFERVFIVSALTGDGVDDILDCLAALVPHGPWHFPEDQLSDLSSRVMAAEITREKLFERLHDELPYSLTVETEGYAESADGKEIRIDQTIYVQRDTQKAIVLGNKGRQIKEIGQAARLELEQILDARVHLFLFVKVREGWLQDRERYRELGLDFPG